HRIIPNAQESAPRLLEVARRHAFSEDVVIGAGARGKGIGEIRAETARVRAKLVLARCEARRIAFFRSERRDLVSDPRLRLDERLETLEERAARIEEEPELLRGRAERSPAPLEKRGARVVESERSTPIRSIGSRQGSLADSRRTSGEKPRALLDRLPRRSH